MLLKISIFFIHFSLISIQIVFTQEKGYFTDCRDKQAYKWVKIGNQIWMAENLNYKLGNSWLPIEVIHKPSYDAGEVNKSYLMKGRLYDFITAENVCPAGWRLPIENDWVILLNDLGCDINLIPVEIDVIDSNIVEKLTSKSWNKQNVKSSGFNAFPTGCYYSYDDIFIFGSAFFWYYEDIKKRNLSLIEFQKNKIRKSFSGFDGYSIRCIKID